MSPESAEVVVRVLALELDTTAQAVRAARSLRHDLGMDSIAAASILFSLEEELGVEMDLESVEGLDSLTDIVAVVGRALPQAEA